MRSLGDPSPEGENIIIPIGGLGLGLGFSLLDVANSACLELEGGFCFGFGIKAQT